MRKITIATRKRLTKQDKINIIMSDFKLFTKNFVKIVDNSGELIPFNLNEQQEYFINGMSKFNIVSKARQIGYSTMSLALCLFYAITKPNTNYLIVSYKGDSSSALFEKLKMMNDHLDRKRYPNLFTNVRRDNKGELLFENGSRITCVTAGHKDIGRGSTYQYILISEFAFFSNQQKVLLSAEQALAKNEDSKIVIETTSNGFNYYQQLYMSAYKRNSKYKAFFTPWYASAYAKQFRHEHNEAEKWYKENNKGERLNAKELSKEEQLLHVQGVNFRFLMWRRWKLADMTIQEFYQEFPSNPMESFISTGHSVFDQTKILERLNYTINPLENSVLSEFSSILKPYINKGLYIYHMPKRQRYFGGVDTSTGSGGDYSTISIFDTEGQQVASFYRNDIPVYKFAQIVDALGRYFNYAFLCIERNSYGLPLIERLRKDYEYLNLYKQRTFDQRGRKKMQLGFTTTQTTKAIAISDLKEQFELGMINIECKETLQQMQIFVEMDGRLSNKRAEGNHDDLVISMALACQAMKENKYYVDV